VSSSFKHQLVSYLGLRKIRDTNCTQIGLQCSLVVLLAVLAVTHLDVGIDEGIIHVNQLLKLFHCSL
jgi:hypothetical protein